MTNQARHNQVVKNDDEANNRYESANSWRSCFINRMGNLPVFYAYNSGTNTTYRFVKKSDPLYDEYSSKDSL